MKKILLYLLLLVGALTFLYPFIWMLGASLASEEQLRDLALFPSEPHLRQLRRDGGSNSDLAGAV